MARSIFATSIPCSVVPLGIGITFSSPMSVAYAFNQTIVGFMFGGNLVRLNVFKTLSSECSKVVVP